MNTQQPEQENEYTNGLFGDKEEFQDIQEDDVNNNNSKKSLCKVILGKFLHFKVEPIVLTVFFCSVLTDAITTDLTLNRACLTIFHLYKENCTVDNMTTEVRNLVQPYSSQIILAKSLIEALFPAILSLFIGPWMDINGRKPFLIISTIGMLFSYILWLIFSYIKVLSPIYFLIASFPSSLSGGKLAVLACSFSYLSDTTTQDIRAIRMALMGAFVGIGTLLGNMVSAAFTSSSINDSPLGIFSTAICVMFLTVVCVIFILPESVEVNQENETKLLEKCGSFFNLRFIKENIKVLFSERAEGGKIKVLMILLVIAMIEIIEQGENIYIYLSVKAAFSWTLADFNKFNSIVTIIAVVGGTFLLVVMRRVFKITEITIMLVLVTLQFISSMTMSLSKTSTMFHIGKAFGCFIEIIKALAKSKISHLIATNELGKIFSMIATIGAIAPLIGSPLYSAMNVAVLVNNPLYIFFLSAGLILIMMIFLIIIQIYELKYSQPNSSLSQ